MYMFVVYLFIFYKLIFCSHRTHTYMCLHFVAVLSIRMANKVNIPSKNSALIAMIADEGVYETSVCKNDGYTCWYMANHGTITYSTIKMVVALW